MNKFNFSNINLNNLPVFTGINFLFKIGFLVVDLFTIIFLLIMIKQISSMDHIVHDSNDFSFIKTFSFLLLLISVSLFIVCIVIL
ncbi:MAG TPA: DUF5657 family protein [Candidatus Sulfotelmatobacter sp.]|nr:DUF5657 family protein [Candidatus Sulfotelmatobacter sp.]